jgi:hypothetical protein
MQTIEIPVKVYAIAAYEAAALTGEDPADVFDDNYKPRARWLAIVAIKSVFPRVSAPHIAKNLGFIGDGRSLSRLLQNAQESRWWRDHDLTPIIGGICLSLRLRAGAYLGVDHLDAAVDVAPLCREPIAPPPPAPAAKFTPRQARPARVISACGTRPVNVTASLLGDPPPGRREMLAGMKDEYIHNKRGVYSWGYDR